MTVLLSIKLRPRSCCLQLILCIALTGCSGLPAGKEPCSLADRPASLPVLAENSARNVYELCLEEHSDIMLQALLK